MVDPFILDNKVCLITGGGAGIGAAIARRFAEAGARVVIADRQDASALAGELGCRALSVDVSSEEQVAALMAQVVERFGRIDVLVNNAGVFRESEVAAVDGKVVADCLGINFNGAVWAIKYAVPHMPQGAAIVNMSSMGANMALGGSGIYDASKAAMLAYTRSAAIELASRQIRVNALCPGMVATAMGDANPDFGAKLHPLGRVATPDDVALAVQFLASAASSFISGIALPIDGGMSAGYAPALLAALE